MGARCLSLLFVVLVALGATAQIETTEVVMEDGTRLATDVWLPLGFGDFDTVLLRTPYGRTGLGDFCLAFNLVGYACVAQDARGRFDSSGSNTVIVDEAADGRRTVEWIGDRFWSSGRVAAFGFSALGNAAYALMPDAPDGLVTALSMVATADVYDHAFVQGGAFRESLVVNWLEGIDAYPGFHDELLEHRLYDEWWTAIDASARPQSVTVPALHIGGWYDIFLQGTLDAFESLQVRGGEGARGQQWLIIGPWSHETTGTNLAGQLVYPVDAVLELPNVFAVWLERWLEGEANVVDEWPAVQLYLMGAMGESDHGNRWIGLDQWPPASEERALYLGADGTLDARGADAGERQLRMDPDDPVPTLGGANLAAELEVDGRPMGAGPFDLRSIEHHGDLVSFDTPVARRPLAFIGRLSASVWLRPDTPDLDLAIRLADVYPDGRVMLLTDGIARARMRCGSDRECLLTPGVPVQLDVDLWSTAYVLAPGHRLRLYVSGSNHPRFEVNPNGGGDLNRPESAREVARPVLLTGPEHPSRLILPVVESLPRPVDGRVHPQQRSSFRGFLDGVDLPEIEVR